MSKKQLWIIGIILAVIAVVAVFFVVFSGKPAPASTVGSSLSSAIVSNAQYAHLTSAGKIRYFSGSTFVELDLKTQTTSLLAPIRAMPRVISVRWGTNGALFEANGYSGVDELDSILISQGLSESRSYWWYVSFPSGQISLLPGQGVIGSINDTVWQNDASYLFIRDAGDGSSDQPTEMLYQASIGGQPVLLGQIDSTISLNWANTSSLIYFTGTSPKASLKRVKLDKLTPETVATGVGGGVAISPDGNTAVTYSGSPSTPADLKVFDLKTPGAAPYKRGGFGGAVAWSDDGQNWVGITPGTGTIGGLVASAAAPADIADFNIKVSATQSVPAGATVIGYDNKHVFILDENNVLYVGSADSVVTKSLGNLDPLKADPYADNYSIVYDGQANQYNVYIRKGSFHQGIQQVLKYIQGLGVDPYRLNIKWYADGISLSS